MSGEVTSDTEGAVALLHRDDESPCGSTVENDRGVLRCTEHGRHIWCGFGAEYRALLEQRMIYAGGPVVIKCRRPGCREAIHGRNEPEATTAAALAGWSLSLPDAHCPRHRRSGHLHAVKSP